MKVLITGGMGVIGAETIEITTNGARRMHTFPMEFQRIAV